MITSINEFRKILNENNINYSDLIKSEIQKLLTISDEEIISEFIQMNSNLGGNKDEFTSTYLNRIVIDWRNDCQFVLDDFNNFIRLCQPKIEIISKNIDDLKDAIVGYANNGDPLSLINENKKSLIKEEKFNDYVTDGNYIVGKYGMPCCKTLKEILLSYESEDYEFKEVYEIPEGSKVHVKKLSNSKWDVDIFEIKVIKLGNRHTVPFDTECAKIGYTYYSQDDPSGAFGSGNVIYVNEVRNILNENSTFESLIHEIINLEEKIYELDNDGSVISKLENIKDNYCGSYDSKYDGLPFKTRLEDCKLSIENLTTMLAEITKLINEINISKNINENKINEDNENSTEPKSFYLLNSRTKINTLKPETNEFVSNNSSYDTCYILVKTQQNPNGIIVSGSDSAEGYGIKIGSTIGLFDDGNRTTRFPKSYRTINVGNGRRKTQYLSGWHGLQGQVIAIANNIEEIKSFPKGTYSLVVMK